MARQKQTVLKRRLFGDPILRKKAKPVAKQKIASEELAALVRAMRYTLSKVGGVGMAAPQIGEGLRVAIIAIPEARSGESALRQALINPKITRYGKKVVADWEGCLSLPGVRGLVPRPYAIDVTWADLDGSVIKASAEGFVARVIQHELDHLDGILYVDRMTDMTTLIAEAEYAKLMEAESTNKSVKRAK